MTPIPPSAADFFFQTHSPFVGLEDDILFG